MAQTCNPMFKVQKPRKRQANAQLVSGAIQKSSPVKFRSNISKLARGRFEIDAFYTFPKSAEGEERLALTSARAVEEILYNALPSKATHPYTAKALGISLPRNSSVLVRG